MDKLRQDIESLKSRVEEKQHELVLIQQELSVLTARLEDAISQKKVEELRSEKEAELKKQAEEAARIARAEAEKREEEVERENQMPEKQPNLLESEPEHSEEADIPVIGEAQHEAIMRTIDELSKDIGLSRSAPTFDSKPTLVDRVSKQKVNDIKRAIGINERFLYANELFDGDMSALTRAIDELNHVDSEADANRLLNETLGSKYQWNEESETVIAFKTLVSRRFVDV